jgi:peptidyl-tRNA hydrolase, PTH1 family
MRLFVGLGNPGPQYERNRHNIGFVIVSEIARRHNFGSWRRGYQGEIAEGTLNREKVILLRPLTFMNGSGRAVQEALHFFKLGQDEITVFHDEIELPPAKVRVKIGGGIAGHNGLRSISECIGSEYWRVRLGVGHPGIKALVEDYVLSDFPRIDWPWVKALVETVADNVEVLGTDTASFPNKVHLAMELKGFDLGSLAQRHRIHRPE